MEIRRGTLLVKNGIRNEVTDLWGMSEGEIFKVIRVRDCDIKVKRRKNGEHYTMFKKHFLDSNGQFIVKCMWRQYEIEKNA